MLDNLLLTSLDNVVIDLGFDSIDFDLFAVSMFDFEQTEDPVDTLLEDLESRQYN